MFYPLLNSHLISISFILYSIEHLTSYVFQMSIDAAISYLFELSKMSPIHFLEKPFATLYLIAYYIVVESFIWCYFLYRSFYNVELDFFSFIMTYFIYDFQLLRFY